MVRHGPSYFARLNARTAHGVEATTGHRPLGVRAPGARPAAPTAAGVAGRAAGSSGATPRRTRRPGTPGAA
eukprot:5999040-Lingulodinium_polyedra.AAC.1